MATINNIVVQAGGRGLRLETLTLNKPKALVPIDNLPIIFHLFKKYPDANYKIIADYKSDVLEKYLHIFAKVNYEIIRTSKKGTTSGIKSALSKLPDEPFMLIWCDLILDDHLEISDVQKNYVGISKVFECRWSFVDNCFVHKASRQNGVAGFFIFKNKDIFKHLSEEGEFVKWLSEQNISFETINLCNTKEFGTMLAYQKLEDGKPRCRPFNSMQFEENFVIKTPITSQGEELAKKEVGWYKKIQPHNFDGIPQIYSFNPLKMERINGENIFVYNHFTKFQKKKILEKIVKKIKILHSLEPPIKANYSDCNDAYIKKTFDRLDKVQSLVPFANKKYININGKQYKNIFFIRDEFEKLTKQFFPDEFRIIHGDITFSNIMLKTEDIEPVFIDPRGYFGQTLFYGDADYDWAKLYYSVAGNYDQFNRKKFALDTKENEVLINIVSNGWEDIEEYFFDLTCANRKKIQLLHAIIWLSLTTYAWEDYDSICGAFYKGLIELNKVL